MNAVYASLIAVFGTLLGSFSTYLFQQRTAARAEASAREERLRQERSAREERLRQERLAACSEFAAAVTKLKTGVVAAWLRRADRDEHRAALAEADRLGSLAEAARFRLLLASGRPEPLADTAFGYMGTLDSASDLPSLKAAEEDFEAAVTAFIMNASERLAK